MSFAGWLIGVSIFVIILAITFGIAWSIRNQVTPASGFLVDRLANPVIWTDPFPGPNPDKNLCQVYTFPTYLYAGSGLTAGTVIPGTPTLNSTELNELNGFTGPFTCIDSDQIAARQVTHNCIAPKGVINEQLTTCRLLNGGFTGLGGSETFFTPCPGVGAKPCPGQIAAVSINFQAPDQSDIYCIQGHGD